LSTPSLLELLESPNAQERTIAAAVIGDRKIVELIMPLCQSLKIETQLYPRLAASETLGKMGKQAVVPLINLLGRIGTNQETSLPLKYCNKKSYPLPRDMAARTLTKLGSIAIPELINKIRTSDGFATQQAIDALGSIVSKTKDKSALSVMVKALEKYAANEITVWKIVRALSGFKFSEAVKPLLLILENRTEPAIRWEAIRSLGQIGIASDYIIEVLNIYSNDDNTEIIKAAKIAAQQLAKYK
jgi:HEAT repeat protein